MRHFVPRGIGTLAASVSIVLLLAVPASAQRTAGTVKSATGEGYLVRGGQSIRVTVGQALWEEDALRTAADGRLGVTLKDGTRLSLGGNTELQLRTFAYAPAEGRLGLALKVLRGAAAYISGRIAELAPGSVKIETPTSVIAVRGTHLLIAVPQP